MNYRETKEQSLISKTVPPGTPDLVRYYPDYRTAVIIDRKFGYNVVERAELNLQLRNYAVLAAEDNPGLEHAYVSIIQPRAPYDQRITLAHYTREDIDAARKEIQYIVKLTTHDRARLNPGEEQCRRCKARLICPALSQAITLTLAPFTTNTKLTKTAKEAFISDKLAGVSDESLAGVLDAINFSDFIKDLAKEETRKRIRDGKMETHYLGKESEVRNIVDVKRAISLLTLGRVIDRDRLLELADLPITRIEETYREATNASWKEASDKVNKVLSSVIEITTRKPRIIKK